MPGFGSIRDQQRAVRLLTGFLIQGNIPHAFLFTGLEGVGKRTAAVAFAMACNCTSLSSERLSSTQDTRGSVDACGICVPCRKIAGHTHPDVVHVTPKGSLIRIEQIRELVHVLAMKPYEAAYRIAIVPQAHTMTPEAGNALLKTLEEPPAQTLLILTASGTQDLLPTIVSRCQHVAFRPISMETLTALLMEHAGVDSSEAAILVAMSLGSVTKALAMHRKGWLRRRRWLVEQLESLASPSMARSLAFARQLSEDKDTIDDSLEIMKTWFRDVAVWPYDPERIVNSDMAEHIKVAAGRQTPGAVARKMAAIETAQQQLRANTNPRITLEVLALELTRATDD